MVLEIVNRSEILTESSAMSREGCLPGDVGKVQKRLVPRQDLFPVHAVPRNLTPPGLQNPRVRME